jgi:hypothetical protein
MKLGGHDAAINTKLTLRKQAKDKCTCYMLHV